MIFNVNLEFLNKVKFEVSCTFHSLFTHLYVLSFVDGYIALSKNILEKGVMTNHFSHSEVYTSGGLIK